MKQIESQIFEVPQVDFLYHFTYVEFGKDEQNKEARAAVLLGQIDKKLYFRKRIEVAVYNITKDWQKPYNEIGVDEQS